MMEELFQLESWFSKLEYGFFSLDFSVLIIYLGVPVEYALPYISHAKSETELKRVVAMLKKGERSSDLCEVTKKLHFFVEKVFRSENMTLSLVFIIR